MSNLDLLFIHANNSADVYQVLATNFSARESPIWAAMLAKRAEMDGLSSEVLDCEALGLSFSDSIKRIEQANATLNVIVVYGQQPSASTQNMFAAELIASKLQGEANVLMVGAHPSALPGRTADDNPDTFVCQGEGPETIKLLCQAIKKHSIRTDSFYSEIKNIPGLYLTAKDDYGYTTMVIKNLSAPLIQNLDKDLPGMAFDKLPMSSYRTSNWHSFTNNCEKQPFSSIYTSLGCPFHCTFCMINAPFGGSSFRYWSPEFTVNQLEILSGMGIKNIKIADEMFVLQKNHFLRICELIIERNLDLNIWAYARIDTIKESYLEKLKKAGVNWLALGIESGNKLVRQEVVKGKFEDVNIYDIVKKIKNAGINVIGNYIFGLPEDTLDSMEDTLQMALDLNCEFANFYSAMAYPGSKLYTEAIEKGQKLPPTWLAYSQHAYETFPLNTKHVDNATVLKFRDEAFIKYFSGSKYLNMIKEKFGDKVYNDVLYMNCHSVKRKLLHG
jgi:radical SAM superfamily enzyme YgiQ (UPF0313 family)